MRFVPQAGEELLFGDDLDRVVGLLRNGSNALQWGLAGSENPTRAQMRRAPPEIAMTPCFHEVRLSEKAVIGERRPERDSSATYGDKRRSLLALRYSGPTSCPTC